MIPITKPTLSPYNRYAARFQEVIESGILTNGKYVEELEEKVCKYLNVKYCVAVSSCTSGLMLALKGLGLKGEVILPSFTFSATGHAVLWNGLTPIFVDIREDNYCADIVSIEKLITKNTSAILAAHMFGNPCDVEALNRLAKKYKLELIFDAAHAFGAEHKGKKVGSFGDAEVFSCSPTKVMTTGEGGFVTTNNKKLADFCRIGRNYGDDGTYNTKFNGLNARMSELHAIIGIESLNRLEENLAQRVKLVRYFTDELIKIDKNIVFQKIRPEDRTTYKDFSLYIDKKRLGYDRDDLYDYLLSKDVTAKKYFYPPLHLQKTYKQYKVPRGSLPVTNNISKNVISLPMFSHMSKPEVDHVLTLIKEYSDGKRKILRK